MDTVRAARCRPSLRGTRLSRGLLLFDLDGTLLRTGGPGLRPMTIAFEAIFGVADAFAEMLIAGRTDTYLLSAAFARAGLPDTPDAHARFHASYLPVLTGEIRERGRGRYGVMPGVETL